MCGISGIVTKEQQESLMPAVKSISKAMAHRGPDAEGFFEEGCVALGHLRLSIIDLSVAANQPLKDNTGRYVLIFNGEIYNFKEIKARLTDYDFKTSGDSEVIVAAYAKWGAACLNMFKGMFAFAIWDRAEQTLFIARDRFGVKPLYYYKDEHRFIFASEIRGILASGRVPRKVNQQALADYLKYQSFVSPLTIIENIYQLPAGSYLMLKKNQLEIKPYWDLTKTRHAIEEDTETSIHARIRELLYKSVERRLISDVPLGAFLSGGIDSSAIVGIMAEVNQGTTNAFTISFEEKDYDETKYAELVAKKFRVDHSKVLLRPKDFLEQLPNALDAMDTPSGDGLNTYVVSKAIRQHGITVALSGVGGDELFAGYPIFHQYYRLNKWHGLFDKSFGLRKGINALLPGGNQKMTRLKEILAAPTMTIADIYPVFRQIQNSKSIRRFTQTENGRASGTLERELAAAQEDISHFDILSQVSIADYLGYTQSVLLKDTDQMSMASSLEVREPFFDHDLVEYVLNVPDRFKYPVFPKSLLVKSLGTLLPPEIVHRKKQGFVLPYDLWLRQDLKKFCTEKIHSLAARSFFSEKVLVDYWEEYLVGKGKIRWADIWIFIVLEHWLEKNNVG